MSNRPVYTASDRPVVVCTETLALVWSSTSNAENSSSYKDSPEDCLSRDRERTAEPLFPVTRHRQPCLVPVRSRPGFFCHIATVLTCFLFRVGESLLISLISAWLFHYLPNAAAAYRSRTPLYWAHSERVGFALGYEDPRTSLSTPLRPLRSQCRGVHLPIDSHPDSFREQMQTSQGARPPHEPVAGPSCALHPD